MESILRILALVGKITGLALAIDVGSLGVDPKVGIVIVLVASTLKDVVNRVGDYLDNQKMDNSFGK
jgi:hypothetical protein